MILKILFFVITILFCILDLALILFNYPAFLLLFKSKKAIYIIFAILIIVYQILKFVIIYLSIYYSLNKQNKISIIYYVF